MSSVQITGSLPGLMAEGSLEGDWAGLLGLALAGTGRIASVEAIGAGADHVALRWAPGRASVFVTPGAVVDYESFAVAGRAPEIAFSLRVRLQDGTVIDDPTVFRIAVLDVDDTPPESLAFASGGSVAAGAIGAVIGRLAIVDPDSAGPFHFTFTADDEWRFEVVDGTTLKLRDGISLDLDDIPLRPMLIEVSDGRNSAGFLLEIDVTDPDAPPHGPPVMAPGEAQGGVALADASRAVVSAGADSVLALGPLPETGGAPPRQRLSLEDGTEAVLPDTVQRFDFVDGSLERDPAGAAAWAAALLAAASVPGAAPHAATVVALRSGVAPTEMAGDAAAMRGLDEPDPTGFVLDTFRGALGRDPTGEELALHLARLASGTAREQLRADIALSPESLARIEAANPEGIWVSQPLGQAAGGDARSAPPPSLVPAEPSPPDFALDLLLL